jgi:hypothetical protein
VIEDHMLQRDRDILKLIDIDTSRLSPAEIKEGAEVMRRVTQCDSVPGAGQRRGQAIEAWQAFRTTKGVRAAPDQHPGKIPCKMGFS